MFTVGKMPWAPPTHSSPFRLPLSWQLLATPEFLTTSIHRVAFSNIAVPSSKLVLKKNSGQELCFGLGLFSVHFLAEPAEDFLFNKNMNGTTRTLLPR